MNEFNPEKVKELVEKYNRKLGIDQVSSSSLKVSTEYKRTREFSEFKNEYLPPHMSLYEKACNFSEKLLKLKEDPKNEAAMQKSIDICHLSITPSGVISFATLVPVLLVFFGILFSFIMGDENGPSMFFLLFFALGGILLWPYMKKMPHTMANGWRMKASNQMVISIFYIVTYMRQSSNLENAIDFAAEHLSPPLSLDLKRLIWNIETEKYESIKESLDDYLESWREWNLEYIESMHLIESSLYESSESRRLTLLDKSLEVILEGTYEKMLHYAHNLKSPITTLNMLGVIMPILGLVILPLVVSFMDGSVEWYHIAMLYNVFLPIVVFLMGKSILSQRPSGYGDTDISKNKSLKKFKNLILDFGSFQILITPVIISAIAGIFLLILGLSPLLLNAINFDDVGFYGCDNNGENCKFQLLEYKEINEEGDIMGPFGLGAALLSLFLPLSIGMGVGLYYKLNSTNLIKIREESKQLEKEFASAIFQLGSRIGDGIPAEIAFSRVAQIMEGTQSGKFFDLVSANIQKSGMSVEQAIFDPKEGAIRYFPSNMIESSMKILVEASKKGPQIAAQALMNISRYVKEMHSIYERLKDLMADVISSMTSQIKFLTPVIAGIVIGITSMVSTILSKLGAVVKAQADGAGAAAGTGLDGLIGVGMPTYFFQAVVGVYVVQIIYILTLMSNGLENGEDKLNERYLLGVNMTKSVTMYVAISFVIMLVFNLLAANIIK